MFLWILVVFIGIKAYSDESYGNRFGILSFYEHGWFYLLVIVLLVVIVLDIRGYYEKKKIHHFLPTVTAFPPMLVCLSCTTDE
ncbi:MAG: hypothetical protein K2X48_05015 [Chitinophagaceae bacterium]|nr:hypothetical protein [Chitinophagaceae bacterium]